MFQLKRISFVTHQGPGTSWLEFRYPEFWLSTTSILYVVAYKHQRPPSPDAWPDLCPPKQSSCPPACPVKGKRRTHGSYSKMKITFGHEDLVNDWYFRCWALLNSGSLTKNILISREHNPGAEIFHAFVSQQLKQEQLSFNI